MKKQDTLLYPIRYCLLPPSCTHAAFLCHFQKRNRKIKLQDKKPLATMLIRISDEVAIMTGNL